VRLPNALLTQALFKKRRTYWIFGKQYLSVSRPRREARAFPAGGPKPG
jgi:hypothetical protein